MSEPGGARFNSMTSGCKWAVLKCRSPASGYQMFTTLSFADMRAKRLTMQLVTLKKHDRGSARSQDCHQVRCD